MATPRLARSSGQDEAPAPVAADPTASARLALVEENRRLRALLSFGRRVKAEMDLKALLRLIPRQVCEITGCDGCVVLLRDPRSGAVGPLASAGFAPSFEASWLEAVRQPRVEEPATELDGALRTRRPAVYADVAADPRLRATRASLLAAGMRSAAAIPLLAEDELLGVLVAYYRQPGDGAIRERDSLAAMGIEVVTAVRNARLYAQTRRDVRRRDALRKVVASISSELDLPSLLDRVAESAVELVQGTGGSISLVDRDGAARIRAVHNLPSELVGIRLSPGRGIMGQVLATGEPVSVAHYSHDLPVPLPGMEHVRASLAVPIWWQGGIVGVFDVFDADPTRVFDADDREMMELLANHVAIAIENARLYSEMQGHLAQIVSLQQLGTLVLEEHDFDRVLQAVCEPLLRLADAEGVGLALLDEGGQFLELRTVVGPAADALSGMRIPLEGSFAGQAVRSGQPQRSHDAQADPRGYHPSLALGHTRTILSVPMKTRQRTVGVLSIYNKQGEGATFSDRDAELATLFANQAAVAIENARLYEQTREYAVVEERNRLARELHDSVTQTLFSVTLLCQAALSLWERDPARARERLERASELGQGALAEMRALIFELRPMALQEEGLISALRKHLAAVKNREGLDVRLQVSGAERRLPGRIEEAAFRIAQESLNNVVKHARAQRASVELWFDDDLLRVVTADDGVGFNPAARARARTMGMVSMRERAEQVGGHLQVDSAPGSGARVTAELPVPSADDRR